MLGGIRMSIAPLERHEPGGESRAVAVADQPRIERLPDRRDRRNTRARNRADQGRCTDRRDPERARNTADQGQHPDDQPVGDAGRAHQFAGENEERDRQQRVILEPAEHDLMDRHRRYRQERQEGQDRRRPAAERRSACRSPATRTGSRRASRSCRAAARCDRKRMSLTKNHRGDDCGAAKADQQRRMRDQHRHAERHAGLAGRGDPLDEAERLHGGIAAGARSSPRAS